MKNYDKKLSKKESIINQVKQPDSKKLGKKDKKKLIMWLDEQVIEDEW